MTLLSCGILYKRFSLYLQTFYVHIKEDFTLEQLAPILNIITTCLNLFSITVLLWGVVSSAKYFFKSRFTMRDRRENLQELTATKNVLGGYVLLSLEILIAADIIDSIVKPTFEDILRLASIVAIRTVISFFLNKEINEFEARHPKKDDE